MAIAKKPGSNTKPLSDEAAEVFIANAGAGKTGAVLADMEEKGMKPLMIRMEGSLRDRIDAAAKASGLGRSAWIRFQCIKALEGSDGGR